MHGVARQPARVERFAPVDCPHASSCPGCPLILLAPEAQLAAKAARLGQALAPYAVLRDVAAEPVRAAPSVTDYRTRAKLVVAPGPRVGLYRRGGHEVLDLPGCRVLAPAVAAGAAALRVLLADPPRAAGPLLRAEGDGPGRLRAVDLRELRDEREPSGSSGRGEGLLVTLVVRTPPAPDRAALAAAAAALAERLPSLRGVAVSEHTGRSPQLLGGTPRTILGPARHRGQPSGAGAPWVLAAAGGFAQAHREQAAAIRAEIESALAPAPGRRLLDVCAGNGALALSLAAAGARVVAVESFAPAAEAAAAAATAQGIAGLRVRAEPAESALPRLAAEGERFDGAVVNPPRRGLAPRARSALASLCAGPLAYVACEPRTLARDLAHLAWLGLRARRLVPFDLMPLTAEVECVALLAPGAPPEVPVLYEDDTLLAVDKPPHLPTVPHPERPGSLLERVRALPGAGAAVPAHRLDAETSGVCLFARSAAEVARVQAALADPAVGKRYLALVRGVGRARGRIARPIVEEGRARPAATRYRRLSVVSGHALLAVEPETGRTHQIRRHLAGVGQPVLGDERYGHAPSNRHLAERAGLDRPFLHCAALALPSLGLRLEVPLAPDLAAVLECLGGATPEPAGGSRTP
ncbi:MAG: pseudouridine synthase [Deltaproteobacteria bacterium]|nr:pseudouridine synthase [Deltaproteobacteria bacterium]